MNDRGKLAAFTGAVVAFGGAIGAMLLLIRASAPNPIGVETFLFAFWVASPLVALFGVSLYFALNPATVAQRVTAAVTSWLLTILSLAIYIDAVFYPNHSTAALIFISLPLWSLLLVGAVFPLVTFLRALWQK